MISMKRSIAFLLALVLIFTNASINFYNAEEKKEEAVKKQYTGSFYDIVKGKMVIVIKGNCFTSTDGKSWKRENVEVSENDFIKYEIKALNIVENKTYYDGSKIIKVDSADETYFALSENGSVLTSKDLENWNAVILENDVKIKDIIHDGLKYILLNEQGDVYSSKDLKTFKRSFSIENGQYLDYIGLLSLDQSVFVVTRANVYMYTEGEFVSKTQITLSDYLSYETAVEYSFDGENYLMSSNGTVAKVSDSGVFTFYPSGINIYDTDLSLAAGKNKVYMFADGEMYVSTNGYSFKKEKSPLSGMNHSTEVQLATVGNQFVAVDSKSNVFTTKKKEWITKNQISKELENNRIINFGKYTLVYNLHKENGYVMTDFDNYKSIKLPKNIEKIVYANGVAIALSYNEELKSYSLNITKNLKKWQVVNLDSKCLSYDIKAVKGDLDRGYFILQKITEKDGNIFEEYSTSSDGKSWISGYTRTRESEDYSYYDDFHPMLRKDEGITMIFSDWRGINDGAGEIAFINDLSLPAGGEFKASFKMPVVKIGKKEKSKFIDQVLIKNELKYQIEDFTRFQRNLCWIYTNNKWGVINKNLEVILKPKYAHVEKIGYDRYLTKYKGKYGITNRSGKFIVKNKYDLLQKDYSSYLYYVKIGDKYGMIDFRGKIIVPIEFDTISYVRSANAFIVKKNGKYGIYSSRKKKCLLDVEYDSIKKAYNKQFIIGKGNKYGIYSTFNGKIILPCEYDEIKKADATNKLRDYFQNNDYFIKKGDSIQYFISYKTTDGKLGNNSVDVDCVDSLNKIKKAHYSNRVYVMEYDGAEQDVFFTYESNNKYGVVSYKIKNAKKSITVEKAYDSEAKYVSIGRGRKYESLLFYENDKEFRYFYLTGVLSEKTYEQEPIDNYISYKIDKKSANRFYYRILTKNGKKHLANLNDDIKTDKGYDSIKCNSNLSIITAPSVEEGRITFECYDEDSDVTDVYSYDLVFNSKEKLSYDGTTVKEFISTNPELDYKYKIRNIKGEKCLVYEDEVLINGVDSYSSLYSCIYLIKYDGKCCILNLSNRDMPRFLYCDKIEKLKRPVKGYRKNKVCGVKFYTEGKVGFISNYDVYYEPVYDDFLYYNHGPFADYNRFIAYVKDGVSYMESRDKVVYSTKADGFIYNYNKGYSVLLTYKKTSNGQRKYGLVNRKFKTVLKPKYKSIERVSDTLFAVTTMNDKVFIINTDNGKKITKRKFDSVSKLKNGLIRVELNKKYGFINVKGKMIVKAKYSELSFQDKNFLFVAKKGGKYGLINSSGETILPFKYQDIGRIRGNAYACKKKGNYGLVRSTGNKVISFSYDSINILDNGLIMLRKKENYGICDVEGKVILRCLFKEVNYLGGGLFRYNYKNTYGLLKV